MAKQQERDAVRQGFDEILAGNNDILSNIINNDRRRTGRSEETVDQEDVRAEGDPEVKTRVIESTTDTRNEVVFQYGNISRNTRRAQERLITVTFRLPEDLNDWLDEQAHICRKEGVTKQSLIADGVRLLITETKRRAETF